MVVDARKSSETPPRTQIPLSDLTQAYSNSHTRRHPSVSLSIAGASNPFAAVDSSTAEIASPRRRPKTKSIGTTGETSAATPNHSQLNSHTSQTEFGITEEIKMSTPSKNSPSSSNAYFSEKYASTGMHRQGSVTIPLLGQDEDYTEDSPRMGTSSGSGYINSSSSLGTNSLSARGWGVRNATRRNSIGILIICFLAGILVALSGILGPTAAGSTSLQQYLKNRFNSVQLPLYEIHPNGHLYLNPASLDPNSISSPVPANLVWTATKPVLSPIHDLINNATRQWNEKLSRQSQNLHEAVIEYKRRHGRNPPKGFDDWFKFAQENSVILIDEFDSTFNDVLPFYALPQQILRNRSEQIQLDPTTFTMRLARGEVTIAGAHKDDGRAKDQQKLMQRWAQFVSDVNVTMSAHDGPSVMMDFNSRNLHQETAKKGLELTPTAANSVNEDAAFWGFPLTCPPNSRLRRAYDGLEFGGLPPGPSFVSDHLQTMNMCENPEWQYLHGFTSWAGTRPQLLRPLFSFAKTSMHSDILLTPLEQFWDKEPWDPKWEEKLFNSAVWRGTTTGVWFDRTTWWRSSQRVRMWFMSKDKLGHKKVRFDGQGVESPVGISSIVERNVSTADLMKRYIDFAFTGKAGQCDEQDGSCQSVKDLIDFQPAFGWNQANEFKYLLDLDGNAWSGRFHRLLSSNSVVIKSTIFPEWYAGWIQPWVHYIPLKVDYTDLFDIMAFFSGDLQGKNANEDLAKIIAQNGKEYTEKYWRYEDMEAYFFRLALEWARCTADDRTRMDYEGPGV